MSVIGDESREVTAKIQVFSRGKKKRFPSLIYEVEQKILKNIKEYSKYSF